MASCCNLILHCFHKFCVLQPVLLLIVNPGFPSIADRTSYSWTMYHEIVLNKAIIEEREQGIIEIQHHIGELNEMFKDLALLVHEQGIMLDDISSNIESSHDATAAQAAQQLTKASKIQQSTSSMVSVKVAASPIPPSQPQAI
ncbi:hypothetical protein K7X08_031803 [Anisodus acutangulus]|uniref:t-SNARE coiled-coil homology domain-containing protein n=1 Tax=Anisodus acutangulus TaxID=402998 RepID=A0A9Q1MQ19_9SOLA|nr:hypothetical protein K7X08_031803 [Anisodus acutangulus]